MNKLRALGFTVMGSALMICQTVASDFRPPIQQVPEIDGGSAIIAVALTAGLISIFREIKRRK